MRLLFFHMTISNKIPKHNLIYEISKENKIIGNFRTLLHYAALLSGGILPVNCLIIACYI